MALVPQGAAPHPQPPRAPTVQEGWGTLTAEKEYKEGLFGKKNVAIVRVRGHSFFCSLCASATVRVPSRD